MQKGVELEERDYFANPFSEEELRAIIGGREPSEIFAWRSPSFKSLDKDPDSLTGDDLVRLMLDEPRLVRRPLVQVGDRLVIGGSFKAIEEALGSG